MTWWSPLPLLLSSGMVKVRINKGYDCLYCEGLKSYLHIIVHMNVRKFCVCLVGISDLVLGLYAVKPLHTDISGMRGLLN